MTAKRTFRYFSKTLAIKEEKGRAGSFFWTFLFCLLAGGFFVFGLFDNAGLNFGWGVSATLADDDEDEEDADELEEELEEKEEELEELEEKAEKYRNLIDLKQQQKATLQNQLNLINLQVDRISNDIEITKQDISRNEKQIEEIKKEIDQKNLELEAKREDLSEIIRLYYQMDQEMAMEFFSNGGNMARILNQSEYLDQTSQKVDEITDQIEQKKNELESKKSEFEEKLSELETQKEKLDDQASSLSSEKVQKQVLIEKTNGEEEKYQEKLSRVEAQKNELIGDINSLSAETRAALDDILDDADRPDKDDRASTSWYYAQDDKRWAYDNIGMSSSLMKDYGCAITSVAMVLTRHGEGITPGKLAKKDIFYYDLIVWPRSWGDVELTSSTSHGNVSWSTIDKRIKKGDPVIVFVKSSGSGGHYVVIHGKDDEDYIVHDPLFGPNIYLGTTRKLVGAIYSSSTKIDQMIVYED